jgi:hypothetical protein
VSGDGPLGVELAILGCQDRVLHHRSDLGQRHCQVRPIVDPHLSDERTGAVEDPDASGHRGQPVDAGEAESREGDCEPAAAGQDEDDDREPAQQPAASRPRHAGPPSRPAQTGDLLTRRLHQPSLSKAHSPRWLNASL